MRCIISDKHPIQKEIFYDTTRFKVAVCGRRWGKSTLGLELAIKKAYLIPRAKIFIVAPTRQMVKEIFWERLKTRCRELNWKIRVSESELFVQRVSNGARIELKSGEKPDRLRGRGLHLVVLDEYAQMEEEIFTEVLRPALADKLGEAVFIGTPKAKNHFYDLYMQALTKPGWKAWQQKTIDSPFVPRAEVENARRELDPRTFRQEFEATFESYEGRAYCYFDSDVHIFEAPLRRDLPILVACDFNIDPCVWLLAQDSKELTYFFDEIVQRQTDVFKMCIALKERLKLYLGDRAQIHPLIFYGDYSGKSRDFMATRSTWEIVKEQFADWNATYRLRANPSVVDRVNAVNSRMRAGDGKSRFGQSKKCEFLRKDWETIEMSDLKERKSTVGDRTHASDAAGYLIHYEYPLLRYGVKIIEN